MNTINLPHLNGTRVSDWLTIIGTARILSGRYPALTLHWDRTTPVIAGGPASAGELSDVVYNETIGRVPTDGVLPDCDPEYPPGGRDWYGQLLQELWPEAAEEWMTSLVTGSGLWLHPLVRVHAAQTVRGTLTKIVKLLRDKPELLTKVFTGIGRTRDYAAGFWITATGGELPMASPGADWMAIMALPWMPPADLDTYAISDDPRHRWIPTAPGWRQRRVGQHQHESVLEWWLWHEPVPASTLPAVLRLGDRTPPYLPSASIRCGAVRRHRPKPSDPPYLDTICREEVYDGRLDDEYPELDSEQAVGWLRGNGQPTMTRDGLRQAIRRARIARRTGEDGEHLCPEPVNIAGRSMWSVRQLRRWRPRGQGARTDMARCDG